MKLRTLATIAWLAPTAAFAQFSDGVIMNQGNMASDMIYTKMHTDNVQKAIARRNGGAVTSNGRTAAQNERTRQTCVNGRKMHASGDNRAGIIKLVGICKQLGM